jgi:hypothetical protein
LGRIKQCRRIATRYDKLSANYLAFIQLASIRLWLRVNEYPPYNDAGFPAAHFRVLDSSNVAGLLLSYCESLAQELSSNVRSPAI